MPKLSEQVADGVADAVRDIRQKVVEKPWFGEEVTPERVSTASVWGTGEQSPVQLEHGNASEADLGNVWGTPAAGDDTATAEEAGQMLEAAGVRLDEEDAAEC